MKECEDLKKCREAVTDRLTRIEEAQTELRDTQAELSICINEIKEELQEFRGLLVAWKNGKGFFNTAGLIGKLLVWTTITGGAITAIYKFFTGSGQP